MMIFYMCDQTQNMFMKSGMKQIGLEDMSHFQASNHIIFVTLHCRSYISIDK